MSIVVAAVGAWSPLGRGDLAFRNMDVGAPAKAAIARDAELVAAGLAKPFVARVAGEVGEDRATRMLEYALQQCGNELDGVMPGWREKRVGAAIGTSSGGMRSFEKFLRGEASARAATYVGPLAEAERATAFSPVSLVLGACASSTLAIGLGRAWLLQDRCDVALCGGFDAVSIFVAAGFECLKATCGERGPRPFRKDREGLSLGEGAAVVALVRAPKGRVYVTGFSATCDATHLTAPERTGGGLARAAKIALDEAGNPKIDLVSAHGTATQHNDAAESATLRAVVAPDVPIFSLKGIIGHTLGAAGVLETLAGLDAMERGIFPATVGEGPLEEGVRVLDRAEQGTVDTVLKLSSAFGGANSALVLSKSPATDPKVKGNAHISRAVVVSLEDAVAEKVAEASGYPVDRLARGDELVRLTIAAVAKLEDSLGGRGSLRGAGVLVGHGLATVETNALFQARLTDVGAAKGEPRRFPYTTPNAAAGECAVCFGLTGPAFAVGGGPHGGIEAISVAIDLIRTGSAERIVVVAVDEANEASAKMAPGTRSGAVALVVSSNGGAAEVVEHAVRFERACTGDGSSLPPMSAHTALLPLVDEQPSELAVDIPWGGFAKMRVRWL